MKKKTTPRYIVKDREQSPVAEAFRALVASIQEARQTMGQLQTILFTGASRGDGTTMTAANTAVCLANSGKRVILIDCDLRQPTVHQLFGLQNEGVANLVRDGADLAGLLKDSGIKGLKVLPGGPVPNRPIEVLSSPLVKESLAKLQANSDYVIINSSPILFEKNSVSSDACVLAAKVDGVVLVLDSNAVRVPAAKKVMALLNGAKATIIGTVLNDVDNDREVIYNASSQ